MAPTTRKRAKIAATSSSASTGGTSHAVKDGSGRDDIIDNSFEGVFAVAQSDHDSDHSDYAVKGPKKRKRKSDNGQKAKPKRSTILDAPSPLAVADLSDNEYVRNEEVTAVESDDDGLWAASRRNNAKALVTKKKDEGAPEL
jgi:hypothetical protein